jgi:hypothetical protein
MFQNLRRWINNLRGVSTNNYKNYKSDYELAKTHPHLVGGFSGTLKVDTTRINKNPELLVINPIPKGHALHLNTGKIVPICSVQTKPSADQSTLLQLLVHVGAEVFYDEEEEGWDWAIYTINLRSGVYFPTPEEAIANMVQKLITNEQPTITGIGSEYDRY